MKKIFKYLGICLSVILMGAVTACNPEDANQSADLGLGIKVFFPTNVVPGQVVNINGTGFTEATEVVFPDNISVTNFEIVTDDMIRVVTPKGINAEGGKIIVRTAEDEAESKVSLTLGNTVISGFSKQPGELVKGKELLSIYGTDLEFINKIELLDEDGNPLILEAVDFYRKGSNLLTILIPQNIYTGEITGKMYTVDGRVIDMDTFQFEPAATGHWETVKETFWTNDGSLGDISWNGIYRFGLEGNDGNNECAATFPQETWDKIKSGTFYMTFSGASPQVRVTTGWWSPTWTGNDLFLGNELIADNGDGTYTLAVTFGDDPIVDLIDAQHVLFTGTGYKVLELYFAEEVWVEDGDAKPKEVVIWEGDGSAGAVNWNGVYRFSSADASTGEEIYAIPMDLWEGVIKGGTFYMTFTGDSPQIRVTSGWWTESWADIFMGDERITDNEDGTYSLEVCLDGTDLLGSIDQKHLLFTGSAYTPVKLSYYE